MISRFHAKISRSIECKREVSFKRFADLSRFAVEAQPISHLTRKAVARFLLKSRILLRKQLHKGVNAVCLFQIYVFCAPVLLIESPVNINGILSDRLFHVAIVIKDLFIINAFVNVLDQRKSPNY